MVPAAVTDASIDDLAAHLEAGDVIIDGGNSYYVDDLRRPRGCASRASTTSTSEPAAASGASSAAIA